MKTPTFILTAAGICGAVLAAGISTSLAQPDEDSPGSIPPPVAPAVPPKRLTTPLFPAGPTSNASGTVVFSMTGDALIVTGKIESLEPSKSYQLVIEPRRENTAGDAKTPPGSDGPPAASPPSAADSTSSGSKESKTAGDMSVPKSSGDLGTVTSDSAGVANINKTLRNVELGTGQNGIIGSTFIVRQVGSASDAAAVASGVIIPPSGEGPAGGNP